VPRKRFSLERQRVSMIERVLLLQTRTRTRGIRLRSRSLIDMLERRAYITFRRAESSFLASVHARLFVAPPGGRNYKSLAFVRPVTARGASRRQAPPHAATKIRFPRNCSPLAPSVSSSFSRGHWKRSATSSETLSPHVLRIISLSSRSVDS
jgi:hypothetical protein